MTRSDSGVCQKEVRDKPIKRVPNAGQKWGGGASRRGKTYMSAFFAFTPILWNPQVPREKRGRKKGGGGRTKKREKKEREREPSPSQQGKRKRKEARNKV